jgi:hypothetical protein
MRECESAYEILSPLSTLTAFGKVSCVVLGAITPYTTCIANDKGARIHLSIDTS